MISWWCTPWAPKVCIVHNLFCGNCLPTENYYYSGVEKTDLIQFKGCFKQLSPLGHRTSIREKRQICLSKVRLRFGVLGLPLPAQPLPVSKAKSFADRFSRLRIVSLRLTSDSNPGEHPGNHTPKSVSQKLSGPNRSDFDSI